MHICINIKLFSKDDFITNNSMMLILLAMDYIKKVLSEKLNVTVIIIIMLKILLKNMAHIKIVSNFYTY
jgi:hypothetical protein